MNSMALQTGKERRWFTSKLTDKAEFNILH